MVCHEANLHGFPYECWTGMYWTSLGCHRTLWELAPPGRRSAFSWWRVKGGFLSEFEIKINTKFTRKSNEKIYSLMMRMRNPWVCSHCCMTLNYIFNELLIVDWLMTYLVCACKSPAIYKCADCNNDAIWVRINVFWDFGFVVFEYIWEIFTRFMTKRM